MKRSLLLVLLALLFVMVGCKQETVGSKGSNNENPKENNELEEKEDVTITIAHPFGEDIFEDRYKTIEGLSDHIDLDFVYWDGSREHLEELFAEGIEPDIFNTGNVELLQEYDAIITIDELIERHDFDTSVIQPSIVSFLESFDDEERMIGVSDGASYYGLFFNKEIFDLFGVPYPDLEKPMTWKEVLELSKKLTAERNGVEYVGLDFSEITAPFDQFGVNLTDPETGEVFVADSPEAASYLELIQEYYNIPGMREPENVENCTFCEERAAMSIGWHGMYLWGWGGEDDPTAVEHMDIAPLPVWPEMSNTSPYLSGWPIMISSLSDNQDEAFEVLMGYVSEQNQLQMSRAVSAGPTTIYPTVQNEFAADNPFYDGKNTDALFILDPQVGEERKSARWDSHVDLNEAVNKLATTNIDVPTLLRELKEEAEISIENARGSGE